MNSSEPSTTPLVTTASRPEIGIQATEPVLLSVQETAKQLAKSTSTVYRIDRKDSPFRFVMKGRRVFIDSASLDAYIASKRRTDNHFIAEEARTSSEDQEHICDFLGKNGIGIAPVVAEPTAIDSRSSGCGQRDLIISQHHRPFVVFYLA